MDTRKQILVVDDDLRLRGLVESHLQGFGFGVRGMSDGRQIESLLAEAPVDLIVLDLGLPHEDGLQICRRLRQHHDVPILMLTARGDEVDRILGLEMGADDYLAKPFHPRELVARIQAILRRVRGANRPSGMATAPFQCGPFSVDMSRQEILRDGKALSLTSAEFQTLATLIQHEGQPLTREKLMWLTRGRQLENDDRSIDMQISRLRRLLDGSPGQPRHIRTVWGHGYLFVAEP
ncbi:MULTISPECIES: response regulator [Acidithiobacillus]|jgi:two-component system phosphate regulon response regulator OmpR|uniref:Response regulator n=1 Tax=Acidithiobacillus ferruginosus TaxID=3063951 RepID=A0ACD5II63_9PROT|nr:MULTISPECIES: response regulator [Acidithiobacillus]MBU2814231.1 response regulator [Acidithiobacillus ferruginosus]MDD5376047.1 response regulator [Acidithiobacillus sp.]